MAIWPYLLGRRRASAVSSTSVRRHEKVLDEGEQGYEQRDSSRSSLLTSAPPHLSTTYLCACVLPPCSYIM